MLACDDMLSVDVTFELLLDYFRENNKDVYSVVDSLALYSCFGVARILSVSLSSFNCLILTVD